MSRSLPFLNRPAADPACFVKKSIFRVCAPDEFLFIFQLNRPFRPVHSFHLHPESTGPVFVFCERFFQFACVLCAPPDLHKRIGNKGRNRRSFVFMVPNKRRIHLRRPEYKKAGIPALPISKEHRTAGCIASDSSGRNSRVRTEALSTFWTAPCGNAPSGRKADRF